MPTHTPSPHRFITRDSPAIQKAKPKPHSSLRHGVTTQTSKLGLTSNPSPSRPSDVQKVTPARRFVIAPPGSVSATHGNNKAKEGDAVEHSQLIKSRRTLKKVESIDEGSPVGSPDWPDNGEEEEESEEDVAHSVEQSRLLGSDREEEDPDTEMLFAPPEPKRRRISPEPIPSSPTRSRGHSHSDVSRAPQALTPIAGTSSHRFLVPSRTPAPFSNFGSLTTGATPASSRPHFILPPQETSPTQPAHPLPDTFSPQRKGQKYVPGGMASTLQSWIIDVANTGFATQNSHSVVGGRDKEDGVKFRIKVTNIQSGNTGVTEEKGATVPEAECFPGGMTFVEGDTNAGLYNASRLPSSINMAGETRVVLSGQGSVRTGRVHIKEGDVVGIKAPLWDVEIAGETWISGVEWVVLP